MKYLLLLLGLLLARAGAASTLPADTLPGQTQFARKLSRTLCERLTTESQTNDLTKLSQADVEKLFTKLMYTAMGEHLDEYQALSKQSGKAASHPSLPAEIGQDAVMDLMSTCPAARPLLVRMGMKAMGQEADIPVAERLALAPIAEGICQRLDTDNAKKPYAGMTPAGRSSAIQTVMQTVMLSKSQELTDYYGEDAMQDEDKMRSIGTKIGLLVFEQCPSYILLISRDAQRAGTAGAEDEEASPPPPPPKAKAPVRRPAPPKRTPVKK